ncbi:dual specificity testis-specific protein kinase 1 isoform X2 [Xenopus laevis]|uniref:dual-specificity kinase n=1 Tax=Xenopus laevis TaxID=8355 RepID=A0A8J0VKS5_XENLA|nr:dual specificity testis-specific protein kinase 1 isoform X2 [Xenopus laevis]
MEPDGDSELGTHSDVIHGLTPNSQGTGRLRPSSYRALRSAVSNLARIDDFYCEKIGSGFFSEVFKVRHRQSGQIMVLKMNKMMSNRGNMLREVQLMNRLCHPNILRFMGVCVQQGQLHALTEYINGGNLEQLLQSAEPLPWGVRVKLSLDIARGLRYLHSKGVFHRDLTSKNCLVRCEESKYSVVVGDFGLAEKIPDHSQTEPLSVVGSPYWMAPEVLRGELYNEKADVFAFGIILCEIIARIPADPDYLPRTEDFGLDIKAFRELVSSDCPSSFLQLAFHCCRMSPESRPSFSEVSQRLEDSLENMDRKKVIPPLQSTNSLEDEIISPWNGSQSSLHSNNQQQAWDTPTPPDQRLSRSQSDMFSPQPQDPYDDLLHDTPARVNPFSQREDLKGGRIKLFDTPSKSVISLTFELPQPLTYQMNTPVTPEPIMEAQCDFSEPTARPRRCRSLPSSPEICRKGSPGTGGTPLQRPVQWTSEKRNIKSRKLISVNSVETHTNTPKINGVSQEPHKRLEDLPSDSQQSIGVNPSSNLNFNGDMDSLCGEDQSLLQASVTSEDDGMKNGQALKSASGKTVDSVEEKCNGDPFTVNPIPPRTDHVWGNENLVTPERDQKWIVGTLSPEHESPPNSHQDRNGELNMHDPELTESFPCIELPETGEPMDCSSSPDTTEENTFCKRPSWLRSNGPITAPSPPLQSSLSSTPSSSRSPSPPISTWQQEPSVAHNRLQLSDNNNVVCSKPLGWVGSPRSLGSLEGNLWEDSLPGLGCEGGESGSTAPLHVSSNSVLDHEETVTCPACCLGGFSFISVCRRTPPDSSCYQNLNCEASRGLINTAPRTSTPRQGPSRKIPEAQT